MRRGTAGFRLVTSALIALGITLLSWAGLAAGVFQGTQLRLVDALFPAIPPDPRIVVVGIDDQSLADHRLGRWPWSRDRHALLIDRLVEEGASLIGYDVTFSEPSEARPDAVLADSVRRAGNVVMAASARFAKGERLGDVAPTGVPRPETLNIPYADLAQASALVGHANVIPDVDGIVRSLPPVIEVPPSFEYLPSLSLALFALEEDTDGPVTIRPDGVQIGDRLIVTGDAHLMDVNFSEGFDVYSASDVVSGDIQPGALEGKIVLVGATAIDLGDLKLTPLNKTSGEPGVLVHAGALSTMLSDAYLVPDGRGLVLATVFAVSFLVAMGVAFLRVLLSPLAAVAVGVAYFWLAFTRFDRGRVMNLVYPVIAMVLAYMAALAVRYLTELRERRRVTRLFGRYVAEDVVDEVLAAPENALATLEGETRDLSVLFADLRGFTAASEGAEPQQVVGALNVYLDAMVRAVNEELGTVDKFMGDCVMAFWGAPRPSEHHAQRCARAAVRMQDYIDEAVAAGRTAGLMVKGCGVGISTGPATVGNIGSQERLDYTVIGDTVNTSSRLCGVAGPGQIVVTETTVGILRGDSEFRLAELPPLVVKGKAEPLRVFQLLREGQEAAGFAEGVVLEAAEEKGHFEEEGVEAPAKAAGYAPIEPRPEEP